jgi:hypothetical protein
VVLRGPEGPEEVEWGEIEKESIIKIAMERNGSTGTGNGENSSMRQFRLGVFLCHYGRTVEGQKALDDAASRNQDLAPMVAKFLASLDQR